MTLAGRFLPLALLAICAAGMAGFIERYRRNYTRSPVRLFRSGRTVQSMREAGAMVVGVFLVWQGLAQAFGLYVPLRTRLFDAPAELGVLVFLSGMSLIACAVINMGASWQMGFDQNLPPQRLIQTGVFRFSRNPIYLGMVVALLGWMLLIPTLLSLIMLTGLAIGVRRQAVEEEESLSRTFGAQFDAWARDVGRFVPWLGRLRRS
jgi:protein-S-isoprenylcysteine O-methyltransferase Ste14